MPILFPLAALSFLIIYITECLLLYYSYRAPPSFDKKLSEEVLSFLKFAPLFYLAFGYWMASSMQLYDNDHLTKINRSTDLMPSKHIYTDVFSKKGWIAPRWALLSSFLIILVVIMFVKYIKPCLGRFNLYGEIDIYQSLEDFWTAIEDEGKDWTIKEEENARENIGGMKMMLDE